ncbi:MAG: chitin disaccharide deacetylase [Chloroflexota bacterium]
MPPGRLDAVGVASRPIRRLIVNADDLGIAEGVNRGIFELAALGVVTSASLMVTMPASRAAWEQAQATGLDVGLHLNISSGRPLSPPHLVPSLLGPGGTFPQARVATARLMRGRLNLAEVEREWTAQIELYLSTGLPLSHLDSHCQMHMYPGLAGLTFRLARRYGVPAIRSLARGFVLQVPRLGHARATLTLHNRVLAPWSRSRGFYFTDRFTVFTVLGPLGDVGPLRALLRSLPAGVTEFICHPGYVDDELRRLDPLIAEREGEMAFLSSPSFKELLDEMGFGLTTFRAEGSAAG